MEHLREIKKKKPVKKWLIRGQSLVEFLIAVGLSSLLIPSLVGGFITAKEGKVQQGLRLKAASLVKESQEATRVVREAGWQAFAINGIYHPEIIGTTWSLVSGEQEVDGFIRTITISDIVPADPSIKRIDYSVSWGSFTVFSVASSEYLTRYLENAVYTETTVAQFDLGIRESTVIADVGGGEIQLGSGGKADWCEPNLSITPLDLSRQGVANAISAIEGQAFVGTGVNASGVSFANIEITDTDPPSSSILGTFEAVVKTNDVFGEEGYAYIATDTNSSEIAIIDLTASPYVQIGKFDSPGPTNATSVSVSGSVGYMASGDTFYTFDLSSKTGSRLEMDSISLAGDGNSIFVVGTYAYVVVDAPNSELQIIDVTDPENLSVIGQANTNSEGGVDVYVSSTGNRVYLVTEESSSQSELFIIDTEVKTGDRGIISSFDTNGMDPKGVTIVPGNRVIVVGISGEEYQVIDISNEVTPVRCGGLDIDSGINGVSSVLEQDGDAYSYIITKDSSSEFKIIEGGPGGASSMEGTFESAPFDAGFTTAFNRFFVTENEPADTKIDYQVAVADDIGGDCTNANFVFVGPDGTSSTFFEDVGAIFLDDDGIAYENPGRCFKYKAFLFSNNLGSTPTLFDASVNYSP